MALRHHSTAIVKVTERESSKPKLLAGQARIDGCFCVVCEAILLKWQFQDYALFRNQSICVVCPKGPFFYIQSLWTPFYEKQKFLDYIFFNF